MSSPASPSADKRCARAGSPRSVHDSGSVICPLNPPEQTKTAAGPRFLTKRTSSRSPVSGWNGCVTTTKPEGSLDGAALCRLRRHPEHTGTPTRTFRNPDRAHRRWKVAARGQSIPDLMHPSAPAAPLLALTLRYASQTTCLETSNGFACDFDSLTWLLPSTSVDHQTNQDNPPPSLQPHYRTFIATTRRSAPLPRIGTLPLADSAAWGSPLRRPRQHAAGPIRARGSHVPHRSLNRARATSAPDTHLASTQAPARLFPGQQLDPGFGLSSLRFRRFISGSLTFAFSAHT